MAGTCASEGARMRGPGCTVQPTPNQEEGDVCFLVKPRKINSGLREHRLLKASLELVVYPSLF